MPVEPGRSGFEGASLLLSRTRPQGSVPMLRHPSSCAVRGRSALTYVFAVDAVLPSARATNHSWSTMNRS